MMVPDELVRRWEIAYRRYGEASKASTVADDRDTARDMVLASREVSALWRQFESCVDVPWWMAAALRAAAEAFEAQARDWSTRADSAWPMDDRGLLEPRRRLSARPQPRRRQRGEQR